MNLPSKIAKFVVISTAILIARFKLNVTQELCLSDVLRGLIHGFVLKGFKDVGIMDSRMKIDVQVPLLHDEELWR